MLVSDEGIKGVVIILDGDFEKVEVNDETITAGAGASLTKMCRTALDNSLSGLEFAYGIPGSVGGAVFMNAGAYGGEMKDCIVSVDYITPKGEIGTYSLDDLKLGYRTSIFKSNKNIVVGCTVSLNKADKEEIKEK